MPPRLGIAGNISVSDVLRKDGDESGLKDGLASHSSDVFSNCESPSEDLAALDRLITYLLGQPNGNIDNGRRSRRASARGYRQLRPNIIDTNANSHTSIGTTHL